MIPEEAYLDCKIIHADMLPISTSAYIFHRGITAIMSPSCLVAFRILVYPHMLPIPLYLAELFCHLVPASWTAAAASRSSLRRWSPSFALSWRWSYKCKVHLNRLVE